MSSEKNPSLVNHAIKMFLDSPKRVSDYVYEKLDKENFLRAIDAENFQSTLKAMIVDPALIDGEKKTSDAFIKIRKERLYEFAELCEAIVAHDEMYETQLRLVQAFAKEQPAAGRGQLDANLRSNTTRLVRELESRHQSNFLG